MVNGREWCDGMIVHDLLIVMDWNIPQFPTFSTNQKISQGKVTKSLPAEFSPVFSGCLRFSSNHHTYRTISRSNRHESSDDPLQSHRVHTESESLKDRICLVSWFRLQQPFKRFKTWEILITSEGEMNERIAGWLGVVSWHLKYPVMTNRLLLKCSH